MSGRDSAFGVPMCPPARIRQDVRNVFTRCAAERRLLARPTTREYPLKRLRSDLAHALCLDVIFQPVLKPSPNFRGKAKKLFSNPVWDHAPDGAYYKAKRLCSVLQPLVTHGFRAKIEHELERLAINVWRMSKRHFDGLIRRIRAKLVVASKSPEAVEDFVILTTNPVLRDRVFWFTRDQRKGSKNPGVDACLLSQKLGLVQWAKRKIRRELSSP